MEPRPKISPGPRGHHRLADHNWRQIRRREIVPGLGILGRLFLATALWIDKPTQLGVFPAEELALKDRASMALKFNLEAAIA